MALQWERLKSMGSLGTDVFRAKVPGGWLVLAREVSGTAASASVAFYPDPDHQWDGASLP